LCFVVSGAWTGGFGGWEAGDDGGGEVGCGETLTCKRKLGYARMRAFLSVGIGVSQDNPTIKLDLKSPEDSALGDRNWTTRVGNQVPRHGHLSSCS